MFTKILVPYDSSEPAGHALQKAMELAALVPDAHVTVLSVVDWHDYNAETFKIAARMSGVMGDSMDAAAMAAIDEEAGRETADHIREGIAPLIGNAENVEVAVVNGSPHDAITAYAEAEGYDCIAMGHRGMGPVRSMIGSVCYSVLNKTHIPVLIVK